MPERWKNPAEFVEDLPDGTTVKVRVSPADGPYTAAARLLILGKDKQKWGHSDLVAGAEWVIEKDHAVQIHFFLLFFEDATAELDVEIVTPHGDSEGGWTVTGQRGDPIERKLFLFTE